MLVLVKNVNTAKAYNAVSGMAQTECSLCDIVGDRNLACNSVQHSKHAPKNMPILFQRFGDKGVKTIFYW